MTVAWNHKQDQLERKNRALEDELAAERVLSKQLRREIDRLKDEIKMIRRRARA